MTRRQRAATVDDLIADLPTAALQCRELRHAWPRLSDRHQAMTLTPTRMRGKRVLEAERRMECTGGCGVVRIDSYSLVGGGVERLGKPRYQYTRPFLIKRSDLPPDQAGVTVDREHVRALTFGRMFPDTLSW